MHIMVNAMSGNQPIQCQISHPDTTTLSYSLREWSGLPSVEWPPLFTLSSIEIIFTRDVTSFFPSYASN
jgi:hypothetical protein